MIKLYTKRIKTEMLFKLSNLNSNVVQTMGYLKPALSNSAQVLTTFVFGSFGFLMVGTI